MLLLERRENQSAAATYWVCASPVGLIDEVFHDDLALTFVAAVDKRENVADAKETVCVKESLLVICEKVGGEDAICRTLSALVLAGSAGLVLGLSNGPFEGGRLCRSLQEVDFSTIYNSNQVKKKYVIDDYFRIERIK